MKNLYNKYKEYILYIVFGGLTTVINFIVFKLFDMELGSELVLLTNIIAWIVAVIFAYITNKLFVFESKSWRGRVIRKEIPAFVGARLFSLGVEELGLWVFITLLGFDSFVWKITASFSIGGKMLVKIALAFVVIVLNYFFSKMFIFKNKEEKKD